MTSSRRSCSKSTSMSGGSRRSSLTKRSNSKPWRTGAIEVTPSKANRRVRRGTTPLAKNAFRTGEANDGFHGKEIGRVFHALDEIELMAELGGNVVGQSFGIALCCAFPGEPFQALLRVQPVFKLFGRIGVRQLVEGKRAMCRYFPASAHGGFVVWKETQHLLRGL